MMEKRIVELKGGSHIEYETLLGKIATYLFVTTSSETSTNNWISTFEEIEDALCLPEGTIDAAMAEDIDRRLREMYPDAIAETEVVIEEDEGESYIDVTLWDMYCLGYVDDDQCIEENAAPKAPPAPSRHTGLTVKATVTFQRWEGDYARFNGEAEFDACDALDAMGDDMVRRVAQGEPFALDEVYKTAVRLGQIHDYDGPFEVDLDEEHLSDYLAARGIE